MIACSAFCISLSERAARVARRQAAGIDRARTRVVEFERQGGLPNFGKVALTALQLGEGDGFPVVHGLALKATGEGEYAMATVEEENVCVSRDIAGTRPLFAADAGDWIASDHRFFPGEGRRLLQAGVRHEVLSGATHEERRPRVRFSGGFEEAARALAKVVDQSVKDRVQGRRKVAVAFSGGLDSSILACCASKYSQVVACSAYSTGSIDEVRAAAGARRLGLEYAPREVDREGMDAELSSLDLPFEPSLMDRSLWCIYSVASRAASEAGAELILLGQLADEVFGGYAKYERAARKDGLASAEVLMEKDVTDCGLRGLIRDEMACSRWLEPRFPFADGRVMSLGLSIPIGHRLRGGVRKALLREAAGLLGVPEDLAQAPKKAAQYSSGLQKLIQK